jgi:16S rRNA (cytosine1402-N4)-methyltransferase
LISPNPIKKLEQSYHIPVLLNECIDGLNIQPNGVYVDVTFGGGGHSKAILEKLENGKLIAFDQDADAQNNVVENKNLILLQQNFRFISNNLKVLGIEKVDGILADLGVSSHQFDTPERGFAHRFDTELDMRMNKKNTQNAKQILAEYELEKLQYLFKEYGEIDNAHKLSLEIIQYRESTEIKTVKELKEAIRYCTPKQKENQYLSKVFQALRIEVNKEIEVLKQFLTQCLNLLQNNGRLVIISYHSLEDRLVKNYMKSGNFEGHIEKDFFGKQFQPFQLITKKAIEPNNKEQEVNTRSRSAKLRIAQKK